ncbi:hypothetical protein ACFWPU_07905 [Streptomyces sp. NPDC058471]|uniref:hypothetical protein n=1 Tax=Streptomyces sp. NPDC058471 TaxID=3346516 RepID=UPI003660A9FB
MSRFGITAHSHTAASADSVADLWQQYAQGKVLRRARTARDPRGEPQALHELGATYLAADRLETAGPPLEQGRTLRQSLATQATDPHDQRTYIRAVALSDVALGQVAIGLGDTAAAAARLATARATLTALKDGLDAARALAWLARAHAVSGDYAAAEHEGRAAVEECRQAGSPRWVARGLELLGHTLREGGQGERARTAFEESLQIYTAISPRDADRVRRQLPTAS